MSIIEHADPQGIGAALQRAVTQLRAGLKPPNTPQLGGLGPFAEIALITPSSANGVLALHQLALQGPLMRVSPWTPGRLARDLAEGALLAAGHQPAPERWRLAAISAILREGEALEARYREILAQPGWAVSVDQAIQRLREAGVDAETLKGMADARARLLGGILEALEARRAEAGLFELPELCASALAGPLIGPALPATRPAGAIILGDLTLPPCLFDLLKAWLAARPVIEVSVPPLHNVPAAPHGLRAALPPGAAQIYAAPVSEGSLAALKAHLFTRSATRAVPQDDEVKIARTPDEVREVAEVTRAVQAAIREGVALDQIAVVLPDPKEVVTLAQRLRAAGVPCAWFTGPPLRQTAPARLLRAALRLAQGNDGVRDWYALLRDPTLDLRARLRPDCVQHSPLWRRALAQCGASEGAHLREALSAWGARGGEANRDAARGLRCALEQLEPQLQRMAIPAPLSEHARRWRQFMSQWTHNSTTRARLFSLLESWGDPADEVSDAARPARAELVDLPAAAAALEMALEEMPALDGRLTQPRVLIGSPMLLLGGAFQRVFITGLNEKRFPTQPRQDPLLPDALKVALNEGGARLLTSAEHRDLERRRFAAAVSACQARLWLSAPRFEMIEGRPVLPGALLLDVVTALQARPGRYADLEHDDLLVGSRALSAPKAPIDALGEGERLRALALSHPEGALVQLAHHPIARRLLALHWSIAQVARGAPPDAYTGQLDPAWVKIPGMDGEEIDPKLLARLIEDPAEFLLRDILGARDARALQRHGLLDRWGLERMTLTALEAALLKDEALLPAWEGAWAEAVEAATRHQRPPPQATLEIAARLATDKASAVLQEGLEVYPLRASEAAPDPTLPWRLKVDGLLHGGHLCALEPNLKGITKPSALPSKRLSLALAALASAQGLDLVSLEGQRVSLAWDEASAEPLRQRLREATARARSGLYPITSTRYALRLSGEVAPRALEEEA
ncbi:hypothetical protein KKF91_14590 [Myxococcota bacterium]|nr:hypothetical protein [Myxococcota bacterium]MBU1431768.1 hypothetical protein [Myxococcota bacterium]MBU1897463.1 hypothetical protein [Myxococcota bacterium]